jgi:hypothetical protein
MSRVLLILHVIARKRSDRSILTPNLKVASRTWHFDCVAPLAPLRSPVPAVLAQAARM